MSRSLTENIMQFYLANYFDERRNIIIPNVYWGFLEYEADLLICTNSGYLYEIEIKTTKSDLKRDRLKNNNSHADKNLRKLYFAIPKSLNDCYHLIPDFAGIITVAEYGCQKFREAKTFPSKPLTIEQRFKLARLGTMRIWKLYKHLYIKK